MGHRLAMPPSYHTAHEKARREGRNATCSFEIRQLDVITLQVEVVNSNAFKAGH
jgi:hypothetical protein